MFLNEYEPTSYFVVCFSILYRESLANFVPHVGMEFRTSDEAWAFWLSYGGQKGFEVRKRYTNKRPSDGKITLCKFVCANEGHRLPDKMDHLTKCPRAKTRTDCQVHMNLKIV
jgi:zinc finger SWIM domain-containing protein 3